MDIATLITSYGEFKVEVIGFQGELMELILLESDFNISIGDSITCSYNKMFMEARIIRIDAKRIFLFVPKLSFHLQEDRRNSIRIEVNMSGLLVNKDLHIPIKITTVSQGGISFISTENLVHIDDTFHLAISSDYLSIVPHVKVVNQTESIDGIRFGTEILFIQQDSLLQLKKFLMYHHVLSNHE